MEGGSSPPRNDRSCLHYLRKRHKACLEAEMEARNRAPCISSIWINQDIQSPTENLRFIDIKRHDSLQPLCNRINKARTSDKRRGWNFSKDERKIILLWEEISNVLPPTLLGQF